VVAAEERTAPERRARWQRGAGWALAIGLAALYALVSLIPLFYGVLAFEVRCGDDCGDGSGWMEDGDAWQWVPFGMLGLGAFVLALALLVALVTKAERAVPRVAVANLGCGVLLGLLVLGS
jgi:hypothetical protein